MKVFEHFNKMGAPCPICNTHEDKSPVLIPIAGTEDGNNCEALQVHLDCIDLTTTEHIGGELVFIMVVDKK